MSYIRGKQFKLHLDGRLYDLKNDPRELSPFYPCNDTEETKHERIELTKQLSDLLEESQLSEYNTKDRLIKLYGNLYHTEVEKHLLQSFIIDNLAFTPTTKMLEIKLSNYLKGRPGKYNLRFRRGTERKLSGLAFADVSIKSVQVVRAEAIDTIEINAPLELTTRIDHQRLRKTGNNLISYLQEGDDQSVSLGELNYTGNNEVKVLPII